MAVSVLCLFLVVPWICLQCVIVVFPGHTHCLYWRAQKCSVTIILVGCHTVIINATICTSTRYTMGCSPVREDNPQALASGLCYVQADNPWYNYFIPPTSV